MGSLHRIIATALSVLALASVMSGQDRVPYDYNLLYENSPWLSSRNAAGLCTMPAARSAKIEGTFGKQDGGLKALNESDDSFNAGILTESVIKISDKVFLYGKVSYNYFNGKDIGGPILMDPDYNPINFHEASDTTVGPCTSERYHLAGGFAYKINRKWSIGASIDYESADRTKAKDPRFLNVWMDLGVDAGFRFAPSDAFSSGVGLIYRRTLEQLDADRYGLTDEKYFTFIDLGGFYGERELFDGYNGFVAIGQFRPMFNSFYGASLQIEAGKSTKVFNELTYLRRSGYYGKRSSTTVTFTEHDGNIIEYNGSVLVDRNRNLHRICLKLRYEGLTNAKNIYRMNTDVGDYTVVEYFGQNEVLDRTDLYGAVEYSGFCRLGGYRPLWEYGGTVEYLMRQSLTTIYPYYRNSSVAGIDMQIRICRNIIQGKNMFSVGAEGLWSAGGGNPAEDGSLASSTSDAPRSADIYMHRDFEFRTAMQAGGELKFRYTRFIRSGFAPYIEIRDRFSSLVNTPAYLTGRNRNILEISIGCML